MSEFDLVSPSVPLFGSNGEPVNAPARDYAPWEAIFSNGDRIDAGTREAHVPFSVVSTRSDLEVLYIHFPYSVGGQRSVWTAGVALRDAFDRSVPAGAFYASQWDALGGPGGWVVKPQFMEPGLFNFRPVYWRVAQASYLQQMVVQRDEQRIDTPGAPMVHLHTRYARYLLGWEADRASESSAFPRSVKCVLHVTPVWADENQSGDPVDLKWEFKRR